MKYELEISNNPVVVRMIDSVVRGSVSHAYAVICEDDYTVHAVSSMLIAAILGVDVARVHENGYADVICLPDEKDKVLTSDIDKLTSTAYIAPTELNKKVYRVCRAETMNESAQNKLLKTLEEAPPSAVIVLECTNSNNMLPTVLSRCSKTEVPPLDYDVIKKGLSHYCRDDEKLDFAVAMSGGYFGVAEKYLADEEYYKDYLLAFETLLFMKTSKNILAYSQKWIKRQERLPNIIDCLAYVLEDCLLCSSGLIQKVKIKSRISEIKELSVNYNAVVSASVMPYLSEAKKKLSVYCNAQAVVDGLLFSILEVKSKCQKL